MSHLSHLPFCPVCDHPFCPLTTRHFVALDWPGGAHLCQHVDRQERAETFVRCCGRQQWNGGGRFGRGGAKGISSGLRHRLLRAALRPGKFSLVFPFPCVSFHGPPMFHMRCDIFHFTSRGATRALFFSFFTRRLIFPFHTQGDQTRPSSVTPDEFTKYMLYVTQWRWLQCEAYARRHGELGFWSMVHDLSCPQGFFSLWGKTRHLLSKYMSPVEEVCGRYTHPGPQLEPPTCPSDTSLAPPQTPPRTARTFNIPLRFPPPNPPPPPP